jgi:hypothetical protein
MMKKIIKGWILSLALFTMFSTSAFAYGYTKQTLPDGSISVTQTDDSGLTETKVFSNDVLVHITSNGDNIDADFDVPPFIENGRTLLPIGQLQRLLGGTVLWDQATQTVTIKSNTTVNHTFIMQIGSTKASLDGNPITMDVAPQIILGRTVVPVRFVKTAFSKLSITWDSTTKTVDVTQKNY